MGNDLISVGLVAVIAFIATIPPTVAAMAAFRQTRIIYSLVTSRLEAVKAELAMAKSEIASLKQYIVVHDKTLNP